MFHLVHLLLMSPFNESLVGVMGALMTSLEGSAC